MAAQGSRGSLGLCSEGRCGRPSPCARRGRSGSSPRRLPCCALCTTAAGPGLRAATASTAHGGVVSASAWQAASRATDGVSGAGLKRSRLGASAEAGWAVGTGRTGVPASSSSRARSSCVEGPAIGVEGDSIRGAEAHHFRARHSHVSFSQLGALPRARRGSYVDQAAKGRMGSDRVANRRCSGVET
jgi:hypothetical protein